MPPSKSKLQTVIEESTQHAPSVKTAVKSIANVLLGSRGQTPIESMIQMQHYQLWGFILVIAGLLYIVWLMQKKLDHIDKQYKEQFVLLHRLFKSHQDLQVEVRRKPNETSRPTPSHAAAPAVNTLEIEDEEELVFDEEPDDKTNTIPEPNHEPNTPVLTSELVETVDEPNTPVLTSEHVETVDEPNIPVLTNSEPVDDPEPVEEPSVCSEPVDEPVAVPSNPEEPDYEEF